MGRRVAIVGVGLTKCSSHRKDVTYPELIYEAVSGALAHGLSAIEGAAAPTNCVVVLERG